MSCLVPHPPSKSLFFAYRVAARATHRAHSSCLVSGLSRRLSMWPRQDPGFRHGAIAVASIAALLPPLLLVLGPRWAASVALGVGLGASLLSLLQLRCAL